MKIKEGVILAGLKIELRPVLKIADEIWKKHGQELVVTSGLDGLHSAGSYHYYGYAIDFRTRYFSNNERAEVAGILRSRLAEISLAYQVVLEKTHIHVEFDYDTQLKVDEDEARDSGLWSISR